jgi:hypothetical protein
MLFYKAIYRRDIEDFPNQEPVGLIIAGPGHLEYLIWDHRAQSWRYDPETAGCITKGTDPLPSEEEILAVFTESHRRRAAGTLDWTPRPDRRRHRAAGCSSRARRRG